MTSLNKNLGFYLLFSFVGFYSCTTKEFLDPCSDENAPKDRVQQVRNGTSGTISVMAQFENSDDIERSVAKQTSEVLFFESFVGPNSQLTKPFQGITSLVIVNESGDTSKKDFRISENWCEEIFNIEDKTKCLHENTFTINDEDF